MKDLMQETNEKPSPLSALLNSSSALETLEDTVLFSLSCLLFQMLRQNQRAFVNQDKNSQDPSVSVCLQKKTAGMKHSEVCSQIEKTTLAQPVRWRGLTLTHKPQNINFHITETPVFS